ncbi:MAG: glycosyltransferase family 1 protein [Patescibacteria group bacterium]|nr:glycosyltransferase family 1 protein [Patescibacteria group bacterium]
MSTKNQKPKTIAIDARMYGATQTGIGNYIYHLMKYLFEIDKKNNYLVFLLPEEYDKFELPNERVKKVKVTAKWYGWKEQIIFPLKILKHKINLIHFPHFNSPILYHWIAPFLKIKTITTIHDLTPYYFPGHKMNSWLRRKSFKLVFSTAVKKSSRVIAVSEYTKKDMIKIFLAGASCIVETDCDPSLQYKNQNKIQVIYEGVDEQFQIIKSYDKINAETQLAVETRLIASLRKKYKITKPFIFYTGVWRNHKNLVGLIKAFDLIVNKYKINYQLVLGGKEDAYYPEVRQTWEKLNLGNQIIRMGFIDQKELPLLYNAADAFVIPSFREGFGLIGLEAMACGTPVVSSGRTSLPEILGEAAIYFNPDNYEEMAEKIAQVIQDENLKNNLIQKGLQQVEKYNWKKMAEETLEIYEEVMDGN